MVHEIESTSFTVSQQSSVGTLSYLWNVCSIPRPTDRKYENVLCHGSIYCVQVKEPELLHVELEFSLNVALFPTT